jgi:hypothetical protein
MRMFACLLRRAAASPRRYVDDRLAHALEVRLHIVLAHSQRLTHRMCIRLMSVSSYSSVLDLLSRRAERRLFMRVCRD